MRWLRTAGLAAIGLALLGYTVGLGIYAAASTRAAIPSQPDSPAEARRTIERLGLAEVYPFHSRFTQVPGGRMHYVDEGRGPVLLCVHGNPTWSFLYRDFVRELSRDHRVIAVDLLGFGLSEKPERPDQYSIEGHVAAVAALLRQLDLRDVTLVMQDWGGPIALGVALEFPERIRGLVVMNTLGFVTPGMRDGQPIPLLLRVLRAPVLGEELVQGLGVFNRVFVPAAIQREQRRSALVRRAYAGVQGSWQERAGTLAFPRLIPADLESPVVALLEREDRWLASFRGPALIAWGMRDGVFDPTLLAEWRQRLPRAQVLELPDAGHYVPEDAWEQVVPRVRRLLAHRSTDPAPPPPR